MIANCFSEIKKVDTFFANIGGRFSYEASFDKEGNIINLIRIYDFKNLKSSSHSCECALDFLKATTGVS